MDSFELSGFGRFDSSVFGLRLNLDRAIADPFDPELLALTLKSFHGPLDDRHRRYVAGLGDPARRSLAIALFTLACHETKHFHDLLVTPYGSVLMRQYTTLALASLSCTDDLVKPNGVIALPLRDWADDWPVYSKMTPALGEPPKAVLDLAGLIGTMLAALKKFDGGSIKLPDHLNHLTASTILEGLAITAQERTIVSSFGEAGIPVFRKQFDSEPVAKRYFGSQWFIEDFLGMPLADNAVELILLASLCGNFQEQDRNRPRYPTNVLLEMLAWLRKNRAAALPDASPEEVLAWSTNISSPSLAPTSRECPSGRREPTTRPLKTSSAAPRISPRAARRTANARQRSWRCSGTSGTRRRQPLPM
jgi:hypothetical protein